MRLPPFFRKIPAVLLVALLAIATSGQAQKPASKPSPSSAPPMVAPDFALESIYGDTVRLSHFRGKVVLLYFWATWCGPCKIEMPWFVELQDQYSPQGLQIVGISLDEDATKAEIGEFSDSVKANYPILMGDQKVANAYGGVPVLPESFLIARDGKIVDKAIGLKSKTEIEDGIKRALTLAPASQPPASEDSPAPQPQSDNRNGRVIPAIIESGF
jgi:peroxiredoxin